MKPQHLSTVEQFRVPDAVVNRTWAALRQYGRRRLEGRVVWTGTHEDRRVFRVRRCVVPYQECSAIDTIVEHEELLRIATESYRLGETLAIQVHTHPGAAFHSATDNAFPLIRELGALSIVVPDYAEETPGDLSHCAVFRLGKLGWLGPLPATLVPRVIRIGGEGR